ncbi:hypothetical protein GW891_00940 [bacterium]|nr:hypothetical protein [bacterium]
MLTIHLFVRLLAFNHRDIDAREYIAKNIKSKEFNVKCIYILLKCGKSVLYQVKKLFITELNGG